MPQDIPWGYGQDRITGDGRRSGPPLRLLGGRPTTRIAAARAGLGPSGERAWLNVRVYDITGRLFDGTNAHSYFDHRVERHERQWFFVIDKPTSTRVRRARPEVGGRLLRQDRALRPRRISRAASRSAAAASSGSACAARPGRSARVRGRRAGRRRGGGGPGGGGGAAAAGGGGGEAGRRARAMAGLDRGRRIPGPARPAPVRAHAGSAGVDRRAMDQRVDQDRVGRPRAAHRVGSRARSPTRSRSPSGSVEVQDNGEVSVRSEGGRTHVMYGPWQVVIRGIGARAERRVLGTWEYRRQVAVDGGVERRRRPAAATRRAAPSG